MPLACTSIRADQSPRWRPVSASTTLGKWVKKANGNDRAQDTDLSETERTELDRLRKENSILRMERDFAKKVATWFAKEQP
jgi:transposase